jgi:dUTP pyrophosphatase
VLLLCHSAETGYKRKTNPYFCTMPILNIQIINRSGNPLPAYATPGASGMDLYAATDTETVLQPLERTLVPTGLYIALPDGIEAQVRPRSGLAFKKGITCLNSPGTIDADYRGEIKILLVNLSGEAQTIAPGERVAQLVIQQVEKVEWKLTDHLEETRRGEGGFGHTGEK